jgi:outer membrane protein assembly factor BamA
MTAFFKALIMGFLLMGIPCFASTSLQVEGLKNLSRKQIDAAIALPDSPLTFTPEDWESWSDEVAGALGELYANRGFLDATFRLQPLVESKSGPDFKIQLEIKEGIRYTFGKVEISLSSKALPEFDFKALNCRRGVPYEKDLVFRDRRELLKALADAGFLHCRSQESLFPDTVAKVINLEFRVETGPAVVFDSLIVRNSREGDSTGADGITSHSLFRSLLPLNPGDTISLATTATFEKKLKSTRVFNFVRLSDTLIQEKAGLSALILSTEEHVPGDMSASLFIETQYGAGISADWSHGNFWGLLHEGRLGGSVAQRKQSIYLGYSSPLFFGSSFRFDNDLISNWYQDSPRQAKAGFYDGDFDITNSSKLSKTFTPWFRDVETAELTGKSEKGDSGIMERAFNLNLINSAYFSFLDDVVNSTRGMRFSLSWGNGGSFLKGGQFLSTGQLQTPVGRRHNWLEMETGFYYPIDDGFKLAFRFDGGRFYGKGGLNSERFYLGGPRSIRSYGWREIRLLTGDEPIYYLTSFEFRTSPFRPSFINPDGKLRYLLGVQVVPFIDYGQIWDVSESASQAIKGQALGLGLRYVLLSIFNIRLDYAMDLNNRKHSQWVLDLAQAF